MFNNLGIHIIRVPSGKFVFVGTVPGELAFAPGYTSEQLKAVTFGARFGPKRRTFKERRDAEAAPATYLAKGE